MTDAEKHAYIAGFFDGEGSVTIGRARVRGKSDYHLVRVVIVQRAKYRAALDLVAEEFGGHVRLAREQSRVSRSWADRANWELQDKPGILRFLRAMQPYCIVKARQVVLGLEFLETFVGGKTSRDSLGRIHGRELTADEIERRERIRLAMREANETGQPKGKPSALPPLDVQVRRRTEAERIGDPSTLQRGEQRYNARLTESLVRVIRHDYASGAVTMQELADQFGVSLMTISKVISRQTWKHIT